MSERENLIQAQMHLECLNEAWCEFNEFHKPITEERKKVVELEISTRIWAAIYLIQHRHEDDVLSSGDVEKVIRLAIAFSGADEEGRVDLSGLN